MVDARTLNIQKVKVCKPKLNKPSPTGDASHEQIAKQQSLKLERKKEVSNAVSNLYSYKLCDHW